MTKLQMLTTCNCAGFGHAHHRTGNPFCPVPLSHEMTTTPNRAEGMMSKYDVYWAPEGRRIATVEAENKHEAKRKAPMPYRKYLGEMYVIESVQPNGVESEG